MSDFVIDTEIIKRFVYDEKITYTFRILPVEEEIDNKYFNIIYYYDNVWQTKILEYTPTEENLILLKSNLTDRFEGTVGQVFQSALPNPVEEGCTTWFIPAENCTRTGPCTSGTCDLCARCINTTVITLCDDQVTYIDVGPSTGGGPTTGTGPGSGASDGSSGSQTTNNEDEIATSPVFESAGLDYNLKTPCSELNKFNRNNSIQQSLRILKGLSSGSAEHGNYMSETINSLGATYLSYPIIPQNPNIPSQLDIQAGLNAGNIIGYMHCHMDPSSTGQIPMFSAADLGALYGIAYSHNVPNNIQKDYSIYTGMLSVGSGQYALKFKNFSGNYATLNQNIAKFTNDLQNKHKLIGANGSSSDLIKALLEELNNYFGTEIGLYKGTESIDSNGITKIIGWEELTLDSNGDILPISCP